MYRLLRKDFGRDSRALVSFVHRVLWKVPVHLRERRHRTQRSPHTTSTVGADTSSVADSSGHQDADSQIIRTGIVGFLIAAFVGALLVAPGYVTIFDVGAMPTDPFERHEWKIERMLAGKPTEVSANGWERVTGTQRIVCGFLFAILSSFVAVGRAKQQRIEAANEELQNEFYRQQLNQATQATDEADGGTR